MSSNKRAVSVKIIHQVAQTNLRLGSYNTNTSEYHAGGFLGLYTKYMFNPGSYSRTGPVALLLPSAEFPVTNPLTLEMFPVTLIFQTFYSFLRSICRISPYITTCIILIKQLLKYMAVMHFGAAYPESADKLVLHIYRNMVLVPKEIPAILFGPTGINILLALFVLIPAVRPFSFFDLLVFITAVTLYRSTHNTGIYNLSLLCPDSLFIKKRKKNRDIVCKLWGASGSHFKGEGLTEKNIRHCVNSISLIFIPDKKEAIAKAYFAGGCFWGIEHLFEYKHVVISAVSGYMGGHTANPTYQNVIQGNTGYLEVVEVTYDPAEVDYEELAKFFFEIHDPTQVDGQGPDREQYLSAVFYKRDDEKKIVNKLIDILNAKGYKIATKVLPAGTFWKAEEYHQNYYDKKKQRPYWHVYKKKF